MSRRLSVALVARGGLGGSSVVAAELALALAAAGHRVAVVSARPIPRLDAFAGERTRPPAERPRAILAPVGEATRTALLALHAEQPLDLIHAHFAGPHLADAVSAGRSARPARPTRPARPRPALVATLHGTDADDPQLAARLVGCDRVLVPSAWLQRDVEHLAPSALLVPNFIDWARFAPVESSRALNGRSEAASLLFVGHLESWKGPSVLLDALRTLPGVRLTVIGGGAQLEALAAAARGLPAGAVEFAGARAATPSDFADADAVVVPSRREAFGLVALEALAAGRAVVASDVGGLGEWLGPFSDDRAGSRAPARPAPAAPPAPAPATAPTVRLVPPGDARALASALRATLARAAQPRAARATPPATAPTRTAPLDELRRRYDRPAGLARHLAVYDELLGRDG